MTTYWQARALGHMVALHAFLNTAIPVAMMAVVARVRAEPALLDFVLSSIAPWSVVASVLVVGRWWCRGRSGRLPAPPTILRDVVPDALGWMALLALGSLGLASATTGALRPEAALDGALAGLFCGLMSGTAIARQARSAARRGAYP